MSAPNPALIALSRAYFNFFASRSKEPAAPPLTRLHEVEEWRAQRLRWLDEFAPGEVRGALLREALGLKEGDPGEDTPWLTNMARWGYPRGWVGERDPREAMRRRIITGDEDEDDVDNRSECGDNDGMLKPNDDGEEFVVFGDEGEEKLLLRAHIRKKYEDDVASISSQSTLRSQSPSPNPISNNAIEEGQSPHRWAHYRTTLFSEYLSIYTGKPLPALPGEDYEDEYEDSYWHNHDMAVHDTPLRDSAPSTDDHHAEPGSSSEVNDHTVITHKGSGEEIMHSITKSDSPQPVMWTYASQSSLVLVGHKDDADTEEAEEDMDLSD